jgi:hypothetical protein
MGKHRLKPPKHPKVFSELKDALLARFIHARPVSYKAMLAACRMEDFAKQLGYASHPQWGMTVWNDKLFSFYRTQGAKDLKYFVRRGKFIWIFR